MRGLEGGEMGVDRDLGSLWQVENPLLFLLGSLAVFPVGARVKRVGEIDAASGGDPTIVRSVEEFSVVVVEEDGDFLRKLRTRGGGKEREKERFTSR
jgi:hypothetical protein